MSLRRLFGHLRPIRDEDGPLARIVGELSVNGRPGSAAAQFRFEGPHEDRQLARATLDRVFQTEILKRKRLRFRAFSKSALARIGNSFSPLQTATQPALAARSSTTRGQGTFSKLRSNAPLMSGPGITLTPESMETM